MSLLSIIVCTRNPSPSLLPRVLAAVAALRVPAGWTREAVLVDNGSQPPLAGSDLLRTMMADCSWFRVITEPRAGLSNAREAGTHATTGELLVWFDDDNEPDAGYLDGAVTVAERHPEVLAFGAGRIVVEFTGPVDAWTARHASGIHQERAKDAEEFTRATRFTDCTPFGTGMVTRRAVMEYWVRGRGEGRYSLDGRKGSRLDSGDDSEILFGAVALGGAVGVSPRLVLRHLIPPARTTLGYLSRLTYATSGGVLMARREVFGRPGLDPLPGPLAPLKGARDVLATLRRHGFRAGVIAAASWTGAMAGAYQAHEVPEPWWLRALIATIGVR